MVAEMKLGVVGCRLTGTENPRVGGSIPPLAATLASLAVAILAPANARVGARTRRSATVLLQPADAKRLFVSALLNVNFCPEPNSGPSR